MNTTTQLTDDLNEIGEAMQKLAEGEDEGEVDLRNAREGIEHLHILSKRVTSKDAFHAYLLWAFLDDLWSNVTMVPTTWLDDNRIEKLFENIGSRLQKMGEHYENHDESDLFMFYGVFAEVYTDYIEWINHEKEETNVGASQ